RREGVLLRREDDGRPRQPVALQGQDRHAAAGASALYGPPRCPVAAAHDLRTSSTVRTVGHFQGTNGATFCLAAQSRSFRPAMSCFPAFLSLVYFVINSK